MPLYVRAGAIVPEQPLRQYAEEAVEGPLVIRVYAGGEGSFSLFEDDGRTFGYESGRYRLREFVWTESGEERSLTARLLHDGFSEAAAQGLTVRVGNLDEAPGEVALSDGTPLRDWRYDSARNELEVPLPVSAGDFRLTLRR